MPPVLHPRRAAFRWSRHLLVPVLLMLVAAAGSGCVSTGVNPVSGNTRAYGYSWEQEVQLGQEADDQIQSQYGVYDDEELQAYVDEVAREVLAESHMRRPDTQQRFRETEFTFRVLDSPVVNAFALPGGYVYVTRGLLAHLNNEAQLAMVMGHEIAHVAARHASQQAARQQLTQGLLVGGAIAGQVAFGGNVAENVMGLGGTAAQLLSLSYSRENERESDRLGVEYAVKAGYEGAEGAAFFTSLKRMQQQSNQSLPTWQSSHPDPGEREDTIVQLAQEWQERVPGTAQTRNQEAYYGALETLVLGDNPRQGVTENNTFYHPDLEFQFPTPAGWQVQNQPRQVAMIAPEQSAYVVFRFAEGDTPEAAAQNFTGQEGLTVEEQRSTTVNGRSAYRVLAQAQGQQGQTLRVLSYFIADQGQVYQFQGVTTSGRYGEYRSAFERTMTGFTRLTDPEKLNVQPTRLAIRSADRRAAFQTFAEGAAMPEGMNATDLAILNQLDLDTTVEVGRPLKLPGTGR
jgi:predicted Zn-dependent protease